MFARSCRDWWPACEDDTHPAPRGIFRDFVMGSGSLPRKRRSGEQSGGMYMFCKSWPLPPRTLDRLDREGQVNHV